MISTTTLTDLLFRKSTGITLVIGAVVGLAAISLLIFPVPDPDPAWGEHWRIRPLLVTPMSAALGSLSFLLKDIVRPQTGAVRFAVFLLSALGFLVALWLGIVLGLDGTLWN